MYTLALQWKLIISNWMTRCIHFWLSKHTFNVQLLCNQKIILIQIHCTKFWWIYHFKATFHVSVCTVWYMQALAGPTCWYHKKMILLLCTLMNLQHLHYLVHVVRFNKLQTLSHIFLGTLSHIFLGTCMQILYWSVVIELLMADWMMPRFWRHFSWGH